MILKYILCPSARNKSLLQYIDPEHLIVLSRPLYRVYILRGFPATETDAAQFLEENNAYYTAPRKEPNSALPSPVRPEDKPAFLSSLDAVIQLTTK